jgi:ADP-heptose:LPS heptosyltransferase
MGLKLLFVRFSSIGDIVLTSAAIRCAKNQLKDVEIHFLSKKSMKMVMEHSPYIDHFHYLDKDFSTLVKSLKEEKFDYVIDLHKNLRTLRLKFALGVPVLSYFKANVAKFLLSKFGINKMPDRHIALRYVDTISSLGVQYDGLGLDFHLPEQLEEPILAKSFQGNYVAFVIGATYFTKKMPVQKIIDLLHQVDAQIILIGGKAEKEEGDLIASQFPEKVWNACGEFSLHQSAFLVKNAQLVIAHDTGLMHIACAFSKNMLMLWGGTSPSLQFYPFYSEHSKQFAFNALVQGLSCQPCSHFGLTKCPKGHFNCMNLQDLPKIADQIRAFLNKLP